MSIKISGGTKEDGIVIGNAYNKYGSSNSIVKWMMNGFEAALTDFVAKASPLSIHEIGCGEGYWTLHWLKQGLPARGSDFSTQVIRLAHENAAEQNQPSSLFKASSIYELTTEQDSADLIVCCEVLEHLEDPEVGLQALQRVVGKHLIISVPQEPLWRLLNMARGKYIPHWGNTPGHLQHWSKRGFIRLVSKYFDIIETKSPLPWTMLLCRPRIQNN